jgi:hypothetical protein
MAIIWTKYYNRRTLSPSVTNSTYSENCSFNNIFELEVFHAIHQIKSLAIGIDGVWRTIPTSKNNHAPHNSHNHTHDVQLPQNMESI